MTAAWAGRRHATRMGPWGGVLALWVPLCVQTTGRLPLGVCAAALGGVAVPSGHPSTSRGRVRTSVPEVGRPLCNFRPLWLDRSPL